MIDFRPLVCVSSITYNHAPYIEDTMNGFCIQQTTFPFVCTILDDASTDGEPEVIENYLQKYFDLDDNSVVRNEETKDYVLTFARHKTNKNCYFAVYYLKYNHYSIGNNSRKDEYVKEWFEKVKYIALCEGDDYWTDPYKLQKQVNFLEEHPDYSMCFHKAAVLDYLGKGSWLHCFDIENREYSSDELFSDWKVPTNSMVFRKECLNYPIVHRERMLNGDIFIVLSCAHTGKVRGLSEYMSVYRIQLGGVTYDPSKRRERTMRYPEHDECIRDNFPLLSKDVIDHAIGIHYYYRSLIQTDKKRQQEDYKKAKIYIPIYLKQIRRSRLKTFIKRIVFFPYYFLSSIR